MGPPPEDYLGASRVRLDCRFCSLFSDQQLWILGPRETLPPHPERRSGVLCRGLTIFPQQHPGRSSLRLPHVWVLSLAAPWAGGIGCRHKVSQESGSMRICSLLPSATEIVFALGAGDLLVGVSHECDYPAATARIPKV